MKRLFLIILLLCSCAVAQRKPISTGELVTPFNGVPSGACGQTDVAVDTTTGSFYTCLSGSWNLVSGGGSAAFTGITSGTNAQAAMLINTGASLAAIGSGTIDATTLGTHAASFFQTALGYTPLNPANNLTDVANTATALSSLSGQTKLGAASTTVSMGGTNGTKALVYVNTTPPLNLSKTYFDGTDWQIAPSSIAPNTQSGDYAILGMDNASPDLGKTIIATKGTAAAYTIAQAGTGSPVKFPSGFFFWVKNVGVGTVTITATTSKFLISTTGGSSTLVILTGQQCLVGSDGTNYTAQCTPAVDATGVLTSAQLPATSTVGTLFTVGVGATTITAATSYLPVSGNKPTNGDSEFTYLSVIGTACTAKNASVVTNNSNGVGTLTFTLRLGTTVGGMADTALVVTVGSGAAAGEFHDTTHTVSIAAGSMVAWKAVMSANTSAQIMGIGFQCN